MSIYMIILATKFNLLVTYNHTNITVSKNSVVLISYTIASDTCVYSFCYSNDQAKNVTYNISLVFLFIYIEKKWNDEACDERFHECYFMTIQHRAQMKV